MRRRQHLPSQWLFTDERLGDPVRAVARLPWGSGVILRHHGLEPAERRLLLRRLRRAAALRGITLVDEADGRVARVHDSGELRVALTRRIPLLFISSLHATRSHPGRVPIPRMRAAALARLAGARAFALGGMDERRFRAVKPLGFRGWGGIDAWIALRRAKHGR